MADYNVVGMRSLLRATDAAGRDIKRHVRNELRSVAEPIRDEAAARFAPIDPRSASRYGISVRRTGVIAVEQRLRRTTGQHPDFGSLQMRRALIPALENNQLRVVAAVDDAVRRMEIEWQMHR